jgi:hypothetical protein
MGLAAVPPTAPTGLTRAGGASGVVLVELDVGAILAVAADVVRVLLEPISGVGEVDVLLGRDALELGGGRVVAGIEGNAWGRHGIGYPVSTSSCEHHPLG